ncbi:hypothetical protein A1D29_01935 [Pasteurellaceae bacterium Orientalotternb1]|nr:hypothetical protein A1D29_01935 [Pasteurellaceae bacterium Orientalotternb1]
MHIETLIFTLHLSLNNHQKHTISDNGGNDKIILSTNDNSKLWLSKDDINLKGRKKEYRYQDLTNRIEQISTTSGKSISSAQVDKLVQAMSAFGSPKDGQISLTSQQQTDLSKIIAANWS